MEKTLKMFIRLLCLFIVPVVVMGSSKGTSSEVGDDVLRMNYGISFRKVGEVNPKDGKFIHMYISSYQMMR